MQISGASIVANVSMLSFQFFPYKSVYITPDITFEMLSLCLKQVSTPERQYYLTFEAQAHAYGMYYVYRTR